MLFYFQSSLRAFTMASKRKRGRPKRALSSAEKARRRREGLLPTRRFSTQRRLANIRWSAGTLTSAQRLLVTTIVNTSKEEHGGEALFGQNSFAIVGSRRGYEALKKLVVELAAGKQIAEDLPPHAQPWVLHTKGYVHRAQRFGGRWAFLAARVPKLTSRTTWKSARTP